MASIYKNGKYYYLSVTLDGKRISRSLGTEDLTIAKRLKNHVEFNILKELHSVEKKKPDLTFDQLAIQYLETNHNWSKKTKELKNYVLNSYQSGKSLPTNPTSRAIFVRTINSCWNWGLKQGLIVKAHKIEGDTKGESRIRVFNDKELKILFEEIKDTLFNNFVRFAYYTGARSGEIRRISRDNVMEDSLVVRGKTGRRYVKLNSQAQAILQQQDPIWSYSKDYVSHKFKKEVRKLEISNARFHDLRRTFGLNLIKQGMSIYKVSKLLGHRSVRTTEQHYAPLLTIEIEDFEL